MSLTTNLQASAKFLAEELRAAITDAKAILAGLLTAVSLLSFVGFQFEADLLRWLSVVVFIDSAKALTAVFREIGVPSHIIASKAIILYYLCFAIYTRGFVLSYPKMPDKILKDITRFALITIYILSFCLSWYVTLKEHGALTGDYIAILKAGDVIVLYTAPALLFVMSFFDEQSKLYSFIVRASEWPVFVFSAPLVSLVLVVLSVLASQGFGYIADSYPDVFFIRILYVPALMIFIFGVILAVATLAPIVPLILRTPRALFGTILALCGLVGLQYTVELIKKALGNY